MDFTQKTPLTKYGWMPTTHTPRATEMKLADMDLDGYPDVITSFYNVDDDDGTNSKISALTVSINDQTGKFGNENGYGANALSVAFSQKESIRFVIVDVDNDDDPDIVTHTTSDHQQGGLRILENTIPDVGYITERYPGDLLTNLYIGIDPCCYFIEGMKEIAFEDFTGDDYPELVFVNAGDLVVVPNTTTAPFYADTYQTVAHSLGSDITGIGIFDYDDDSDPDIVVSNYTSFTVFENSSGSFTVGSSFTFPTGYSAEAVFFEDINNDGLKDLVVQQDDEINVFVHNGTGTPYASSSTQDLDASTYSIEAKSLEFADINGDNQTDILGINDTHISDVVFVFLRNTGNTAFETIAYEKPFGFLTSRVRVDDFNDDDLPDYVVLNFTSSNYLIPYLQDELVDMTPPLVSSFNPQDGVTEVAVDIGQLLITFDEPMVNTSIGAINIAEVGGANLFNIPVNGGAVSVSGNEVIIDLPGDLNYDTDYYVTIASLAFEDIAGNNFSGINDSETWNFSTEEGTDVTGPAYTGFVPFDDSEGVSVYPLISIGFNEEIQEGTGVVGIYEYDTDNPFREVTLGSSDPHLVFETTGLKILPGDEMDQEKQYYISICATCIEDLAGNPFAGITDKDEWNFTIGEFEAPQLLSLSPMDDASDVAADANLILSFDEPVQLIPNEDIYIKYVADGTTWATINTSSGNITTSDNEVTINPPLDMPYEAELYVEIDGSGYEGEGIIVDHTLNLNYFEGITSPDWTFTVESEPDNQKPIALSFTPADNTTDVAIDIGTLQVEFDEDIELKNSGVITVWTASNEVVVQYVVPNANLSVTDEFLSIDLGEDLEYETGYYVQISSNTVQDLAGNSFDGFVSSHIWNFSTESAPDAQAPIAEVYQYHTDDDVPIDAGMLSITFDEPVFTTASTNIILRDFDDNIIAQHYAGESLDEVSITDEVVSFTIPELTSNTSYYVQVGSNSFEDGAGNTFGGFLSASEWYFTTASFEPVVQINDADFKSFFVNNSQINTNSDDEIQVSEAEAYSGNIIYSNKGLSDATGIEAFVNAVWIDLSLNNLISIDLSANIDAAQVNIVNNDLETLVLPDRVTFNNILLNGNNLTSITFAEGISANTVQLYSNPITSIEAVNCSFDMLNAGSLSSLSSVNIQGTDVRGLILSNSQISSLDISSASSLESINVSGCGNLSVLDVSNNTDLITVSTAFSGVQSLDLSNHPDITTLQAQNGQLTELNIKNGTNTNITTFQIQNNSNLECVQVDDEIYSNTNWTNKDVDTQYKTDCSMLQEDQTITFESLPTKTFGDADFELTASASSGLEVTYSSSDETVAIITGNTVSILGAGSTTISASQAGDENYNPAQEVEQVLIVNKSTQIISIDPIDDKETNDEDFEIVVSVTSGLDLDYEITGPASLSGTTISLTGETGTVILTVSQDGNQNYLHVEQEVSFNVSDPLKTDQVITFDVIEDKTYGDADFELIATASSGLNVSFENVSGPVMIDGSTVSIIGVGEATIRATQEGDDDYNPALSILRTFTIEKAEQSITFEGVPDKIYGDEAFDLTGTSSSGLIVSYSSSDGSVATISGSTVSILSAGVTTITATQAGNEYYLAAEDVQDVLTINKAGQSITFESLPDRTFGDDPFEIIATTSSGLPVSYGVVDGPASVTGNTVSLTGAGTVTIEASQAGDANYLTATPISQTFEISKAAQTISVEPISQKEINDAPFEVAASTTSGLELEYDITGPATISGNTITLNGETGIVEVMISQSGNENYLSSESSISFSVIDGAKQTQTISFPSIDDKTYGDTPFVLNATASSGLSISYSVIGGPITINGNEVTITGAGEATIAADQPGNEEYNAANQELRTFTIIKATQTIVIEHIEDKSVSDESFEVIASVDSDLELAYEVMGPASISGAMITLDGTEGTVTVTVSQAGNDNYLPAYESIEFEVRSDVLGVDVGLVDVKIYPNPASNHVFIDADITDHIKVIDMKGGVVKESLLKHGKLDISQLYEGSYLLEFKVKDNMIRKRIIKTN